MLFRSNTEINRVEISALRHIIMKSFCIIPALVIVALFVLAVPDGIYNIFSSFCHEFQFSVKNKCYRLASESCFCFSQALRHDLLATCATAILSVPTAPGVTTSKFRRAARVVGSARVDTACLAISRIAEGQESRLTDA